MYQQEASIYPPLEMEEESGDLPLVVVSDLTPVDLVICLPVIALVAMGVL